MMNWLYTHLSVILVFISLVALQLREIHTKITLSWAHILFATRVHSLCYIYITMYLWTRWHHSNWLTGAHKIEHKSITSTVNSLWPSDAIWCHRTWATLIQVMAWCLTAPSHYLNQCWLIINEVLRHSPQGSSTGNAQDIYRSYEFENYYSKIRATSPRGQWFKSRDNFMYAYSQWETTLQCNVVPHWLSPYLKWSL